MTVPCIDRHGLLANTGSAPVLDILLKPRTAVLMTYACSAMLIEGVRLSVQLAQGRE